MSINNKQENWGEDFDKLAILLSQELGMKLKIELIASESEEETQ